MTLMTIRDMTVSDVERLDSAAAAEASFAMTEDAFRAFYDRTSRSVWGYLARLTGDPSMADDLLQDTYYRFLRAAATHESEAHRRNALFTIATNLARDAYRRRSVLPFFVTDYFEVPSREDAAGQFEHRTDVGRAMRKLRPRDRAMLWLAYVEGFSHKEIAQVLGMKTPSIKLLLFRARRRLAGIMRAAPEPAGRS
jgi:RNA polymerase sigma-70 factor (ECF subfamily)